MLLRHDADATISAKVISVGSDIITNVQEGARIWFNKYSAQPVEGETHAVPETAILALE